VQVASNAASSRTSDVPSDEPATRAYERAATTVNPFGSCSTAPTGPHAESVVPCTSIANTPPTATADGAPHVNEST
jgi:hypothetical protein